MPIFIRKLLRFLHRLCVRRTIFCLNCDQDSLGANGLVREELMHSDPTNHHYKPLALVRLLLPKLRKVL